VGKACATTSTTRTQAKGVLAAPASIERAFDAALEQHPHAEAVLCTALERHLSASPFSEPGAMLSVRLAQLLCFGGDAEAARASKRAPPPVTTSSAHVTSAQNFAMLLASKGAGMAHAAGIAAVHETVSAQQHHLRPETLRETSECVNALARGQEISKALSNGIVEASAHIAAGRGDDEIAAFSRLRAESVAFQCMEALHAPSFTKMAIATGTPGHAALLELAKQDDGKLTLRIYNAGQGLEEHPQPPALRNTLHAAATNPLRAHAAKAATMFEVNDVVLTGDALANAFHTFMNYNAEYREGTSPPASVARSERDMRSLYAWARALGKENVDLSNRVIQSQQKGGDCSVECVFAYFRNNMSDAGYNELRKLLNDHALRDGDWVPPAGADARTTSDLSLARAILDQLSTRLSNKGALYERLDRERKDLAARKDLPQSAGKHAPLDAEQKVAELGARDGFLLYETNDRNAMLIAVVKHGASTTHCPVTLHVDAQGKATGKLALVVPDLHAGKLVQSEPFESLASLTESKRAAGYATLPV
jgi:hypothetical protein